MDESSPGTARRLITVTGEGYAGAPADAVRVQLGLDATSGTPAEALDGCADGERAMVAAVRDAGVDESSITTVWATVEPEWDHHGSRAQLRGYTARVLVTVDVADPGVAGRVASAAVAAGGTGARLHGLVPRVTDPAAAESAARERAYEAARAKAEQLAALADTRLGRLVALVDGETPPSRRADAVAVAYAARGGGEPLDVHAGEHRVAAVVTATWELTD